MSDMRKGGATPQFRSRQPRRKALNYGHANRVPSHDILIEDGGAATTCSNNNSAAHMNLGIFWPMQRAGRKSGKVQRKSRAVDRSFVYPLLSTLIILVTSLIQKVSLSKELWGPTSICTKQRQFRKGNFPALQEELAPVAKILQ